LTEAQKLKNIDSMTVFSIGSHYWRQWTGTISRCLLNDEVVDCCFVRSVTGSTSEVQQC